MFVFLYRFFTLDTVDPTFDQQQPTTVDILSNTPITTTIYDGAFFSVSFEVNSIVFLILLQLTEKVMVTMLPASAFIII
jgi:hypothetical protein